MHFDLKDLRLFVAVAEAGSIAGAAAREHLVASAISKRLAELEVALEVALVQRGARGVTLTAAGLALLAHARAVLSEAARLRDGMAGFASGERGLVRVAANHSAIVQFLPAHLAAFSAARPEVRIDLDECLSEQVAGRVLEHWADVGVLAGPVDSAELAVWPYRSDQLALLLPAGHALAAAPALSFTDVLAEPLVGMVQQSDLHERLARAAAAAGQTLKVRVRVASFDAVCAMVAAGLGLAVVPQQAVAPFAPALGLCVAPLADNWARRQFYLCARRDMPGASPAHGFIEFLRQAV